METDSGGGTETETVTEDEVDTSIDVSLIPDYRRCGSKTRRTSVHMYERGQAF